MKKFWIILVAIAGLVLVGAPANATGSDGVPPYDVGKEGITLPQGEKFKPHAHVNIKYTEYEGATEFSAGIHFDPNNGHPGKQWIGKNFIPWTAFGLTDNFCITWVEIDRFNQHYGEGPHKSMCIPPTNPCIEDPYSKGCEIPPAPPAWEIEEERVNDLVCESEATGYGIVTTEMRDGVKNPEWVETSWTWVLPTDWEWTDWYVTSEERVADEACDPLVEVGSEISPVVIGTAVALLGGGVAMLLFRRRKEA